MNNKNILFIIAFVLLSTSLVVNIRNFYFEELPIQSIPNPQKNPVDIVDIKDAKKVVKIEETEVSAVAASSPSPQIAGVMDTNKDNLVESDSNDSIKSMGENKEDTADNSDLYTVKRVIDGDTIELSTGETVRYIGIDTPETVHPDKTVECFGHEASNKNKELVEGKNITLEKDITDKDKYNRLLRYVYLQDDTFINLYLVKNGYASNYTYPPDVKYQDLFREAELEAKNTLAGLWNACQGDKEQQNNPEQTISNNCQIKGNISSGGEKIYHLPGQKYYDKTVINLSKGERWFCSEDEAQSAGWRKSKI